MIRLAVFVSGGGSNLQALIDHFRSSDVLQIAVVISNRDDAGGLERARKEGIPAVVANGDEIIAVLDEHRVDLIALAGYLKLIPVEVIRRYDGRILNIHPALLPAFGGKGMYGHHVHEAVIASGATESGATVHWVTEEYDRGAIIAQRKVPVLPNDTPDALAARVLDVEHQLYPEVVESIANKLCQQH